MLLHTLPDLFMALKHHHGNEHSQTQTAAAAAPFALPGPESAESVPSGDAAEGDNAEQGG